MKVSAAWVPPAEYGARRRQVEAWARAVPLDPWPEPGNPGRSVPARTQRAVLRLMVADAITPTSAVPAGFTLAATLAELAAPLSLSTRTVRRALRALTAAGALAVVEPACRHRPPRYLVGPAAALWTSPRPAGEGGHQDPEGGHRVRPNCAGVRPNLASALVTDPIPRVVIPDTDSQSQLRVAVCGSCDGSGRLDAGRHARPCPVCAGLPAEPALRFDGPEAGRPLRVLARDDPARLPVPEPPPERAPGPVDP